MMGIRSDQQSAFEAAEATCDSQYPPCGCAAQFVDVEDGSMIDFGDEDSVIVSCDSGSCRASVPSAGTGGSGGTGGSAGGGSGGTGTCTLPSPPDNDEACPVDPPVDGAFCDPIGLECRFGGGPLSIVNPCGQGFSFTVALCCPGGFEITDTISTSSAWPVSTCRPQI
jgi:hypothetical protein